MDWLHEDLHEMKGAPCKLPVCIKVRTSCCPDMKNIQTLVAVIHSLKIDVSRILAVISQCMHAHMSETSVSTSH